MKLFGGHPVKSKNKGVNTPATHKAKKARRRATNKSRSINRKNSK
jgi:hypothetical protein